jgi:hypothetical protein
VVTHSLCDSAALSSFSQEHFRCCAPTFTMERGSRRTSYCCGLLYSMGSANLEAGATSSRSDSIAIPTSGHSPVQLECCTIPCHFLLQLPFLQANPKVANLMPSIPICIYGQFLRPTGDGRRIGIYWGEPKRIKTGLPFVRQSYSVHLLGYQQYWFPERTISLSLFQYHENNSRFYHVIRPDPTSANVITAPTIYDPL